jgi:hypothetical protein
MIRTEDGVEVAPGDRAYNYYDRKAGRIDWVSSENGWFDFFHDDGTSAYLNGERICSLAFAQRKGWL